MSGVYVAELMRRVAGERPVMRYGDQAITGTQLCSMTFRYARAFDRLGIGHGDLVAFFAPTTPEAIAIRYAANLVGAATCYLSAPPSEERRAALVTQLDLRLLVAFPETAYLIPDGTSVPTAFVGGGMPGLRLDELAAAESDEPVPCRARPEDLGIVTSSGGTTGVPKCSQRSFARYTKMVEAPDDPSRRQLVNGKLAYLSQTLVDSTLLGGGTVILRDTIDPLDTILTIEAEKITDLLLLEPQLEEVVSHPELAAHDLSSLRMVMHGGAAAPPTFRRRVHAELGPVVAHGYGASEVGFVSVLLPHEHDRPERFTSAGRIRPGVGVRFRAADGTIMEPGGPGTIEVRTPLMAEGYRNASAGQEGAFADDWYRTGDLGWLDTEGFIHILGRAEDALWRDGEAVTPDLVAEAACQLPEVRFAAVIRDQDAWIVAAVPRPGRTPDISAAQDTIARSCGIDAETVVVVPVDRIPLTEQGKPDRIAIRALRPPAHN